MATKTDYTVRRRGRSWQVNLNRKLTGGTRVQITRRTKAEAEAEAERKIRTLRGFGTDAAEVTPRTWRTCSEAVRILTEKGFPETAILEAATYFAEHNDPAQRKKTFAEVAKEFLLSRQNADVSSLTLKNYAQTLARVGKSFGGRLIHTIRTDELDGWLNEIGARGVTRANYRRHFSILWNYAVALKYTRENVARGIPEVNVKRRMPEILTGQEVRLLLQAARKHNMGRMLPYFAIGCFCGLRPWETRRTSWADVNLETKEVYVTPEACKTSQDRFVTIPDCCVEWLKITPESARKGLIFLSRADFEAVRTKAGIAERWSNDVMRHSAASHLYGQTQNAAVVTAQMGHGLNVFLKHYKRAVTKADGEAYFKVMPTDAESNVVELKQSRAS